MSSFMGMAERLFRPLTAVLNWIGNKLLHLVGLPNADVHAQLSSSEELAYIVEESSEGGLLEPTELLYLENVFDFHERTVGQIMTPRTRMIGINAETSREETLAQVCTNRHSRYPIYEEDRDHIIGILHIKDLARHVAEEKSPFDLRMLAREATFVPESVSLESMLTRFREEHVQIAIVLDEYGGTAGLVTLEDLAEELIGEIQDEFDQEVAPIRELGANQLRVRGDLLLAELTQHYGVELGDEETDTVGGLVMNRLGQIPKPGDLVESDGIKFEVESVEGLAVGTMIITLPDAEIDRPASDED
jgi:CBS domain containing-hemolysin-like protein